MRYLLILFLIFSMISSAGYAEGIVPVLCLMGELDFDGCKNISRIEEYTWDGYFKDNEWSKLYVQAHSGIKEYTRDGYFKDKKWFKIYICK